MKKYIVLLSLLLFAILLCSCGNASDKDNTASQAQKTVAGTNSDDSISMESESVPVESGTDSSSVESKATVDSKTSTVSGSASKEENSSTTSSSEITTSNSSEITDIIIETDEYELPFIPKK